MTFQKIIIQKTPISSRMSTLETTMDTITLPETLVVPTDFRFLDREVASLSQLQAVNVDPKWQEWVRIFDTHKESPDSQEKLYLLHYITIEDCEIYQEAMKEIGHVRGIIMDQENNIVCQSFGYTPEVTLEHYNDLQDEKEKYLYYQAVEGTVLRLFYWNHWFISTHRKIDGSDSYWNGPTFGEMFQELFTEQEEDLDKNTVYIYILQHVENTLIYKSQVSKLFLVATFKDNQLNYITEPLGDLDLEKYLENTNVNKSPDSVGVLAVNPGSPFNPVKLVSEDYINLKKLRGNTPNLTARYLQLHSDPEQQKNLVKNFPSYEYKSIDRELENLARKIHKGYINLFVKKSGLKFPKEQHVVMMRCHSFYKQDRNNNIVKLDVVKKMLRDTPSNYLQNMLKQ